MRIHPCLAPIAVLATLSLAGCSRQPTAPQELAITTETADLGTGNRSGRSQAFVPWSTNPYFPLVPGTTYYFRSRTEEGLETSTFTVTHRTKRIQGVTTRVVEDIVRLDGEIIEHTFDWFAMDRRGNVWYFGEDSRDFEDGKLVGTAGSWIAGRGGARAGIIMKSHPEVGDAYDEEIAPGVAEDKARVLSLNERVKTPYGSFRGCLKTANFTPLEPDLLEHKFYAPGVGMVRSVDVSGDGHVTELVRITKRHRQHDDD